MRVHLIVALTTCVLVPVDAGRASAAQRAVEERVAENTPGVPDPLDAIIRQVVLDLMPREYEDTDDWGKTKPFTTGVEIDLDGLRIDTERQRKELNHGTWERYRVTLASADEFTIQVNNLRTLENAKSAFTVELSIPLKAHARQARWQRGVQLYSISADARATVKLRLECETAVEFDTTTFVPSMRVRPKVTDADIRLTGFKLDRISKLHGDPAKQLGDAFEGRIARIVARKDERLVKKINEKLIGGE